MSPIRKMLIANRGEIALRIIRTCRAMGIHSVAVYSRPDAHAPFVLAADEAYFLEGDNATDTYLNIAKLLEAAHATQADALHPGYGFLSENVDFARAVRAAGLVFIGPEAEAIEIMGSKIRAKQCMMTHGVPVVPGYMGEQQSPAHLQAEALAIGFPVLIKASAGGGGKGMRIVREAAVLEESIAHAQREALHSFGDATVFLERYFDSVRHIEFQIFGDRQGNIVQLGERECSIQRRHQKIVEEAPSPALSPTLRTRMAQAAMQAGKAIGYTNAGTVEFIVDAEDNFYFLEVNTRLQVEHPVTEAVTGLDLVRLQIDVAQGKSLPQYLHHITPQGHAIELRLYAENVAQDFAPATGTVHLWQAPSQVRVDSGIDSGKEISPYYDPMLAKIIAHAPTREEAIQKLQYALAEMSVLGLATNQDFLARLLADTDFVTGNFDTHFLHHKAHLCTPTPLLPEQRKTILFACTLLDWTHRRPHAPLPHLRSGWRNNAYMPQWASYRIEESGGEAQRVEYKDLGENTLAMRISEAEADFVPVRLIDLDTHRISLRIGRQQRTLRYARQADGVIWLQLSTQAVCVSPLARLPEPSRALATGAYLAPLPGEVVRVLVAIGETVAQSQPLLIINSMKMENTVYAHSQGTVTEIMVAEKQLVKAGQVLLHIHD